MSKSNAILKAPLAGENKSENADFHSIEPTELEKTVFKLLSAETKVVGSAVWKRLLTGKLDPKKDIDFVTKATPQQIMNLKENQLFFNPSENRGTLFRCEHTTPPLDIEISDDKNNRNFTICNIFLNSLAKIEDPSGQGLQDLYNRVIATIAPPEQSFEEDSIRILQAIALLNEGFHLDPRKHLTKKGNYETMAETIRSFEFTLTPDAKKNTNPGRFNAYLLKIFNDTENVRNNLFNLIEYDVLRKLFFPLGESKLIQYKELCCIFENSNKGLKLTEIYMYFITCNYSNNFQQCKKVISENLLFKTAFAKLSEKELVDLFNKTKQQLSQKSFIDTQGHFKPTRRSKKKKKTITKPFFIPKGMPLLVNKAEAEQLIKQFSKS